MIIVDWVTGLTCRCRDKKIEQLSFRPDGKYKTCNDFLKKVIQSHGGQWFEMFNIGYYSDYWPDLMEKAIEDGIRYTIIYKPYLVNYIN